MREIHNTSSLNRPQPPSRTIIGEFRYLIARERIEGGFGVSAINLTIAPMLAILIVCSAALLADSALAH